METNKRIDREKKQSMKRGNTAESRYGHKCKGHKNLMESGEREL